MKYKVSFDFGVSEMKFNRLSDLYHLVRFVAGVSEFKFYSALLDSFTSFDFTASADSREDFLNLVRVSIKDGDYFQFQFTNNFGVSVSAIVVRNID